MNTQKRVNLALRLLGTEKHRGYVEIAVEWMVSVQAKGANLRTRFIP